MICGSAGFLGSHLAKHLRRLSEAGHESTAALSGPVRQRYAGQPVELVGVDLVGHAFGSLPLDLFVQGDLRQPQLLQELFARPFDEVYQFAAEMGGAGFIFTGQHDAEIMRSSAQINLNVLEAFRYSGSGRIFFASSACVYPIGKQRDPYLTDCSEDSAYPADPDSEYGWEKLFAERLYASYARQYGLLISVARLHNVYGPQSVYQGGREKAPAALCRKVVDAPDGSAIELWGDGLQTRSFTYIDDCLEGILRLMAIPGHPPVNLGSEERVNIEELARLIIELSGKKLEIQHVEGPQGVRGRNSDNRLLRSLLQGWEPRTPLAIGMRRLYEFVADHRKKADPCPPGSAGAQRS